MCLTNLVNIFDPKYYIHLSGGILEAFGKLFFKSLKIYLYPQLDDNDNLINSDNLKVHPRMKELYKFFKFNGKIVDVTNFNKDYLKIFSHEVLKKIRNKDSSWEKMLPKQVSKEIKRLKLFGYK